MYRFSFLQLIYLFRKHCISNTNIKQKMFLRYTYLHIYTQVEPTKCIYLMSFFQFLISLCSYVSLFLSSTYLSLPEIFQYAYFHWHDKYMVHYAIFRFSSAVYFSKYLVISLLDKFTKQKR